MTTLAAILALHAPGAGHRPGRGHAAPLAIAIISGLAVQLLLVLTVLPALLTLMNKRRGTAR